MTTTIRPANKDDVAAITGILNEAIRKTLVTFTTTEKIESEIAASINADDTHYLVAEQAGRVIGYASYGPFRQGPGYKHTKEHTIHLAPTTRGSGLGRALIEQLEEEARAEDVHVLVAGISSANPEAVSFHAALGFINIGRMPETGHKWGQWLDLILMQKTL